MPARALSPGTELCTGADTRLGGPGCFRGGAFLMQVTFEGPDQYEGIPASDGSSSNIGHLNIWSSRPTMLGAARVGCRSRGEETGTTTVRGHPGVWITCPEDGSPPQDSGHIILQWLDHGILYAVSLHTDSAENRALALTIAEDLIFARPRA